ncbi:TPA: hypothetical protein JA361_09735 [Legionella pneumophila]|nr:hypothetical protein [Legionella pneumophila]HAT8183610.1 hypothetical protein [Legionella pneumophila]
MIYKITLTDNNLAQTFMSIPEGVTTLDLSNNLLGSKSYSNLLNIADSIPPGVTSLDLSSNGLRLTQVCFVTPKHVTSLNLCFNSLHEISLVGLEWLKDSFAHIQTISLSYDTVNSMSREQRKAFRAVFPNIQTITLVDKNGKEIEPSHTAKISNLLRELGGGNPEVPSLLNQCTFFIKNQGTEIYKVNIPEELKERIHNCNPL